MVLPLLVAPELADPSMVLMFAWVYTPGFVVAAFKDPGWVTLLVASIAVLSTPIVCTRSFADWAGDGDAAASEQFNPAANYKLKLGLAGFCSLYSCIRIAQLVTDKLSFQAK
eukprot:gene24252-17564_t